MTRPTPAPRSWAGALDYDYPHDHPEGVSDQELMPADAAGERFLELSDHGFEKDLAERWQRILKARRR